MKKTNQMPALVAILALSLGLSGACKHSGVAVTDRGQVMKINITAPDDLPERGSEDIEIQVSNRGLNKLNDVEFEVEFPRELVIVEEKHGDGINMIEGRGSNGERIFRYTAGNIEVATSSMVKYRVETAFGSMKRSGDLKVTAWQKDLPGERLIETKFIKLRGAL